MTEAQQLTDEVRGEDAARIDYTPWEKQAAVHLSRCRFRVVLAGRQSGKSMTGIAEAGQWSMEEPGRVGWWVTANYKVKDKAWRDLKAHIPRGVVRRKLEDELHLELGNGSMIWIRSADALESLVSEKLDWVICDEFAQWDELAWTRGVRPMLNVTRGPAMFLGTPRGRNWAYRLWLRGQPVFPMGHPQAGQANPDFDPAYAAFHWASWESPYSDPKEIEQARKDLPADLFAQEYGADAIDNASAVFKNYRACIRVFPAAPDRFMCIGVDVASRRDYAALIAMNGRREVVEIDRFQVSTPELKRRVASMAFKYAARKIVVDTTGKGDPVAEDLAEAGFPIEEFVIAGNGQQVLIDGLRIAVEQAQVFFPAHEDLIREMDAFQYELDEKARKVKYAAPSGQHDDLVFSLALAVWGQRGLAYLPIREGGARENYLRRAPQGRPQPTENYLRRS